MAEDLILKRATRITPSGELKHDDYDVLCDDKVVGRIMKAAAAPVGTPWVDVCLRRSPGLLHDIRLCGGSRGSLEGVREGVAWGVIDR
jgi:hypothetical protein